MDDSPSPRQGGFPLTLLMLLLATVMVLLYFNVASFSFQSLGLNSNGAFALLILSLLGSVINIPLTRHRIQLADPNIYASSPMRRWLTSIFHYYPPAVVEEVLAVNIGGALVPVGFSIYLLTLSTTPIADAAIATLVVTVVSKLLARPVPGMGISLPGFVPPLIAALAAVLLVRGSGSPATTAAPVAYIAGTMGALIGADLLNLPAILRGGLLAVSPIRLWPGQPLRRLEPGKAHILSIGGAGVFDGIFLAGIIAAFLAA